MRLDADILAALPGGLVVTITATVEDLRGALAAAPVVPELATTRDLARAWGYTPRQWREWAAAGAIPGAFRDPGGTWRLPRAAAREQFERLLGRGPAPVRSTSHLPRAHGPRRYRQQTATGAARP